MGDKDEVNIASEAEVIDIISQTDENLKEGGDEYAPSAHQDNIQGEGYKRTRSVTYQQKNNPSQS